MYQYYINRITGFFTIVMIILFQSSLRAQYISGPTTVTLGQYADYYFEGASSNQVASASWSVDYGSVQGGSSGVNYVSALFSFEGTNYIMVDYFNGFYWDQVYLQVEVVASTIATPILSSVTQPSCTKSTGSFTITNYNGFYNYTASPSNGVVFSGSTVTASTGNYTIMATSASGINSSQSASVTINTQPTTAAAPTVGSITQPTDANPTGSVVLSNLPTGNWIINPGNVSGTGATKTITGLIPDTTYNFTVTNTLGCVSNASAAVEINIQPSGAVKPTLSSVTHPNCTTSTGSFTITNYNASHTYTANPSAGVSISGGTVTAPTGSYTIMATSASGINSFPSASITVNVQPATPTPPIIGTITQPTVTATGSVVLSNLPDDNWVVNPGNISGYGSTVTITGLAPSVQPYKFAVTNTLGCISSFSANVVMSGYCGISDENYVHTITPTIATTDVSSLNNSQKIEGITYYDGIGRPAQKIGIRSGEVINDVTNTMVYNDIISPIVYDEFGRQTKEYLSYSDTFNCGSFRGTTLMDTNVVNFYNIDKHENTLNPYSQKQFEASPLNRVLKQASPGNDWKLGNGHEIKMTYQTNTLNEVKNFVVNLVLANNTYTPTLTLSNINDGYYKAKELYKTVTYDENSSVNPIDETAGSTVEFKNKQGQVILKRNYGTVGTGTTNEKYDTYYIYDYLGNLSYVIPPKAVDLIASSGIISQNSSLNSSDKVSLGNTLNLTASNSITLKDGFHAEAGSTFSAVITSSGGQNSLDDLCYQYRYDNRKRLVEKKLPGKQWEFIVYDKLDRVVATGPALSPFNDTAVGAVGWMITKYDVFSRPVYTGWEQSTTVNSDGRIAKQTTQNTATVFNESKQTSGTIDGITTYYSNSIAPVTFKLLTVNYYDNYDFPGVAGIPSVVETQNVLSTPATVKGLATGSWTRVPITLLATQSEATTTFYDSKARPVRTYSTNFLGGYTFTDSKLDFTGKPDYTISYHKRLSTDTELKTKNIFTYSPQGRLLTQNHQINDGAIELIASNTYDELGQLVSKKVGNNTSTPAQKVDYTYNIRGWLKGINDISGLQKGSDPKDLFAFKINYNNIPSAISGVTALYNGNIAETQWATNSDNGVVRTYGYKYDNLNRLRGAIYKKGTVLDAYNESMDYDKNGNIMHLTRYGSLNDNTQTLIDNLNYNYLNNNTTNQLLSVDDAISNNPNFANEFKNTAGNDYSYDANGNMLTDANKGITTNIVYNHLNLPTKITFGTAENIVYIYNAAGQKVRKEVTQGTTSTVTDYLGEYQYKDNDLKFFPTAEGYVEHNASSYKYVYQYKDHLGNVRLSYDKSLAVQEENDYYPFGLKHTGYGYGQVLNSDYKYKYNGKELQDELGLNWYSYGFRHYDPAIARWTTMDPLLNDLDFKFDPNNIDDEDDEEVALAMKTTLGNGGGIFNTDNLNPYSYGYNDPVRFDDPDGRCPICIYTIAALLYSEFANAPTGNRQVDSRNYEASKSNKALVSGAVLAGGTRTILNSAKSKAVEKVTEKSSEKKVPNPNGKNGGEAHQKTIDKAEAKMKKEGFSETRREVKVETPKGEKSKRYIDLEGKNPKTGEVKQVQVGKQNKNGTPVARERRAIDDIHQATGKKPEFVPYN